MKTLQSQIRASATTSVIQALIKHGWLGELSDTQCMVSDEDEEERSKYAKKVKAAFKALTNLSSSPTSTNTGVVPGNNEEITVFNVLGHTYLFVQHIGVEGQNFTRITLQDRTLRTGIL